MSRRDSNSIGHDSRSDSQDAGSRSIGPKAALWIGFLAGGWLATLAFVFLPGSLGQGNASIFPAAHAEDPPLGGENPGKNPGLGGLLPGGTTDSRPRGIPNPGGGTSDSNRRAIALSASVGGGESAVYYFDTVAQRLLVYQYRGRLVSGDRPLGKNDRGGLRLLAARHIDLDLKLSAYRDLSERTRRELKIMMDAEKEGKKPPKKFKRPPTKEIEIGDD